MKLVSQKVSSGSVDELLVTDKGLLFGVKTALGVLELVDSDCDDSQDKPESTKDRVGNDVCLLLLVDGRNVAEVVVEFSLIGLQVFAEIIQWERFTIDGVKGGEGRNLVFISDEFLAVTDDHENCRIFLHLIQVSRVRLHLDKVV